MLLKAQNDIIRNRQSTAPVNVVAIAHDLGLRVYQTSDLPNDISGMIVKDKNRGGGSGFAIYVNAANAPVRRRFTIAHEIAHYILHENIIGDGIAEDYLLRAGGLSNAIERQANALAAEILMPWSLVKESQENGIETIDGLAMRLNV